MMKQNRTYVQMMKDEHAAALIAARNDALEEAALIAEAYLVTAAVLWNTLIAHSYIVTRTIAGIATAIRARKDAR